MKSYSPLFFLFSIFFSSKVMAQLCPIPSTVVIHHTNNIRATISNDGNLFNFTGDAPGFQVPYVFNTTPETIDYGGLWLGGYTETADSADLKLAIATGYLGQSYSDYKAGPLNDLGDYYSSTSCEDYDNIWVVTKEEIDEHILDFEDDGIINNPISSVVGFPCRGNPHFFAENGFELPNYLQGYALFFDRNNDGIYNAFDGDFPSPDWSGNFIPAQMTWAIFNDLGNGPISGQNGPFEIQLTGWTAECSETPVLDNTLFTSYKVINRGLEIIDSFQFGIYLDFQLGCAGNNSMGSSPDLNSFFCYNESNDDGDIGCVGGGISYNYNPPVQAVTFMNTKLEHFMIYDNLLNNPDMKAPGDSEEAYRFMSGTWRDGTPLTVGGDGYNLGSTESVEHIFLGDPNNLDEWSMESEGIKSEMFTVVGTTGTDTFGLSLPHLVSQGVYETTIAWSFHRGDGLGRLGNVTLMYDEVAELKEWFNEFPFSDDNPCANYPDTTTIATISLNDFGKNITLFPNPNNGTFELEFPNEKIIQLQVFDVSGKMIWQKIEDVESFTTIHLQNIASGVYFLKVKTENGVFYKKIMIGE